MGLPDSIFIWSTLREAYTGSLYAENHQVTDDFYFYAETFMYDKMGNITQLTRNGGDDTNDQLYLTYTGNQLKNVWDGYASRNQYNIKEYQDKAQNGSNTSVEEMSYDANGNMIKDLDRDIVTIKYNLLNLPDLIQFKNGCQIKNTYSANGQKLSSRYVTVAEGVYQPLISGQVIENLDVNENDNVTVDGTDYIGNIEYQVDRYFDWDVTFEPTELKYLWRVHNPEGYVSTFVLGNLYGPVYNYYRKDHLGNNREVWNASYKWGSATRPAATSQIMQYYPSGLPWKSNTGDNPGSQPYKYGGKEFVEMHGYDSYDFQARVLYPAVGPQFMNVDPLAEDYYEISPYVYGLNNPMRYNDATGMKANDTITINKDIPEVTVTVNRYFPVGTRAMDPVSGFWGWVGYYTFGRTYESGNYSNGNLPVIRTTWNVNADGVITGVVPLTGTVDVNIVGKVGTFLKLRSLVKGMGLEVHHIVEVRHLKHLFKSTGKGPAVILTKAEHKAFTNDLRQALPYKQTYTKTEIIEAYKKVYKKQPEWLKVAIDYILE